MASERVTEFLKSTKSVRLVHLELVNRWRKYYFYSPELFIDDLTKQTKATIKMLADCYCFSIEEYEDCSDNDIELIDSLREVIGYYISFVGKHFNLKLTEEIDFTLRNSLDLAIFEYTLDRLIILLRLDLDSFIKIFPECPAVLWDKIDDLRETSHKTRDTDDYTRCLRKAKFISFTYESYKELNG